MIMASTKLGLLVFFVSIFVLIPSLQANIGDFDKVWEKRALKAWNESEKAYNPNPEEVTDSFNEEVDK